VNFFDFVIDFFAFMVLGFMGDAFLGACGGIWLSDGTSGTGTARGRETFTCLLRFVVAREMETLVFMAFAYFTVLGKTILPCMPFWGGAFL